MVRTANNVVVKSRNTQAYTESIGGGPIKLKADNGRSGRSNWIDICYIGGSRPDDNM